jgi:hypothetical protein
MPRKLQAWDQGMQRPLETIREGEIMDGGTIVEAQVMYNSIKDLTDAKAALEKLATEESAMGWTEPKKLRLMAYAMWLKEHGKEGWYDYFVESMKSLQVILLGGIPSGIPKEPEEWIDPYEYFRGRK